jgi:uracil-DNA glycosylase
MLPPGAGSTIPWFDPESGGVASEILLLLQDPSRTAANGTGFISPDNNDPTARNTTEACNAAGLQRESRLHWNVYPWWVNTRKKGRPQDPSRPVESWPEATRVAARLWGAFFDFLPHLKVVATFGAQAQKGWESAVQYGLRVPQGVEVIHAPSLSPPGYYGHRDGVRAAMLRIAATRS